MAIIDRLALCGVPGLPGVENYLPGFQNHANTFLFYTLTPTAEVPDTDGATGSITYPTQNRLYATHGTGPGYTNQRAWEKHAYSYSGTPTDCNEDGCFGMLGQRRGLRIFHGMVSGANLTLEIDRATGWVSKINTLRLTQNITLDRVGWPQWFNGSIDTSLVFITDLLQGTTSYDDQSTLEIFYGLADICVAANRLYFYDPVTYAAFYAVGVNCVSLVAEALEKAAKDYNHGTVTGGKGLGDFHDSRTYQILAARAHEPPVVSTGAVAAYINMLLVGWALTGNETYRDQAREVAANLESMRHTDGKFYPHVRQVCTNYGLQWQAVGNDSDYNIVPAAEAISGNLDALGNMIIGLPESIAIQQLLDRAAAALAYET